MSPIFTSGLPLVRSINAVSLTKSKGSILSRLPSERGSYGETRHLTTIQFSVDGRARFSTRKRVQVPSGCDPE